jgi:hypothetical protein
MVTKVRKQIYIEAEQEIALKNLSATLGVSEAEIIRQAISSRAQRFRKPRRDMGAWAAELEFIHGLIEEGPAKGGRAWTRDELYER